LLKRPLDLRHQSHLFYIYIHQTSAMDSTSEREDPSCIAHTSDTKKFEIEKQKDAKDTKDHRDKQRGLTTLKDPSSKSSTFG